MPLTEDEAEFALKEIISREQQRLQKIMKPYFNELSHVLARKPPSPVAMPDGRVMRYVGPTATDMSGPYKAPRWLEEICQEDYELRHDLARYRDHRIQMAVETQWHLDLTEQERCFLSNAICCFRDEYSHQWRDPNATIIAADLLRRLSLPEAT